MIIKVDRVLGKVRERDIDGGSSLPASGSYLFQLFVNTAENALYYWTGSAWQALSGGTPPTPSFVLLETGDGFLLETGDKLILE